MATRIELDSELREVLGSDNTYFQPPESVKLKYDCIVYKLDGVTVDPADNIPYHFMRRYEATVIYRDPDTDYITPMLNRFQYCRLERTYTADNLNHQVYTIYY